MKSKFLECGKIINKRGISGELKVECYCDSPDAVKNAKMFFTKPDGSEPHEAAWVKDYKGFLYIKLKDIDSVEKADSVRGIILYVNRDDVIIEDGRNFIADLLGLDVLDYETGKLYGKITDVFNHGASDVYVVTDDNNNEYLVPAVDEIVIETDIDKHVLVKPIPGLFDNAEEIK